MSLIKKPYHDVSGHAEKLISAVGGFVSILLSMWVGSHYLDAQGVVLMVASMGASAVLLFAVPHGALSQPWPLLGGHVISALIGVTVAHTVPNLLIAAPLSVGLAIFAMHYLRCIHPPGGATAIWAVIGGAQIHDLGYQFVLTPVLMNALVMLIAAVLINYPFSWRRYPASFRRKEANKTEQKDRLGHADFKYALGEMGSFVDITEEELGKIYRLAAKHAWQISDQPDGISAGLYYSNGEMGDDLSVRKVVSLDESCAKVTYEIAAGYGLGIVKTAALVDFSNWQRYEVILKNGAWHRIRTD